MKDGTARHRRLCFLITANGGLQVHQWGFLSFGDGHQRGLEQDDALELMQWSAFMDGLEAAGVEILDALRPYFEAYQTEFVTPNAGIHRAAEGRPVQ
jgi:hypothetical protein